MSFDSIKDTQKKKNERKKNDLKKKIKFDVNIQSGTRPNFLLTSQ